MWSVGRQPAEHARARSPRSARGARRALAAGGGRRAISAGSPGRRRAASSSRVVELEVGHLVARLHVLRVAIQRARSPGVFGIVSAASVRPRREVRQVGADVAAARRAADRVAARAGSASRNDARPRALGASRARAGCACSRASARNCGRRLGDDLERHVRVLEPAELGALAAVDARPGRRRAGSGSRWPGIMSIFRFSSGHPEAVDHVGGRARRRRRACCAGMWISFAVTAAVPG